MEAEVSSFHAKWDSFFRLLSTRSKRMGFFYRSYNQTVWARLKFSCIALIGIFSKTSRHVYFQLSLNCADFKGRVSRKIYWFDQMSCCFRPKQYTVLQTGFGWSIVIKKKLKPFFAVYYIWRSKAVSFPCDTVPLRSFKNNLHLSCVNMAFF